ncbi:hypothetical protein niasHT_032884 [Heterodera trifolii]|uniref:F-box domain-containing protein n=1 Tax=Heterodera trifolii TaxID=157864 RepID=A0ABD2INJ0_9BILA
MSDNPKDAEEKMAKAIFISNDCWLKVFELLPPSQLGLEIALISHRFDSYVDEHFKTRKWPFGNIRIHSKIGENGTNEMEIDNCYDKVLPIPQNPLPNNVSGFKRIFISYIDRNAIDFLHRFRPIFASNCPINLIIGTPSDRISESILRNIWPMIAKNICGKLFFAKTFQSWRKFATSILNDCPSLRFVAFFFDECFPEFPCDDSAAASDGQAVAKWLFTPCPDNVPKVLTYSSQKNDGNWSSKTEAFKTAFASASSPVNFIVVISFINWSFADSVVPFNVTNELTREQLALKRINNSHRFVLIRCPIARDESKWTKWEKEAIGRRIFDQWNQIEIQIYEEKGIGDGLLDAMVGPSDQQK